VVATALLVLVVVLVDIELLLDHLVVAVLLNLYYLLFLVPLTQLQLAVVVQVVAVVPMEALAPTQYFQLSYLMVAEVALLLEEPTQVLQVVLAVVVHI
jgi:hypothetical protein